MCQESAVGHLSAKNCWILGRLLKELWHQHSGFPRSPSLGGGEAEKMLLQASGESTTKQNTGLEQVEAHLIAPSDRGLVTIAEQHFPNASLQNGADHSDLID